MKKTKKNSKGSASKRKRSSNASGLQLTIRAPAVIIVKETIVHVHERIHGRTDELSLVPLEVASAASNAGSRSRTAARGLLGIDVSHWNLNVDWARVRQEGVDFAFIKASEGQSHVDERFAYNWRQSKANYVLRGAYHFFRPNAPLEGQINNFLRVIGQLGGHMLPPVLDVEDPKIWRGIEKKKAADLCIGFLEGVRQRLALPVPPIIYMSTSISLDVLGEDERLARYIPWIADYSLPFEDRPRTPRPWRGWDFWQYTEDGRLPGIPGNVDINRFNGDRSKLESLLVVG